jgi:uncharacterized membrane protein YhaH (DUF805 family)
MSKDEKMVSPKSGKENSEGIKLCARCGEGLDALTTPSPTKESASTSGDQMTFSKSISTCMGKFFVSDGRASRPEYWWFFLFTLLLTWFADIADSSKVASTIVNLVLFLPSLSAATRRLHDTDRSAWWLLLGVTIIGLIPLFIWLASKGDDHPNKYGNPVKSGDFAS